MTKEGQPGLVPVPASQSEVRIGTFAEILRQAGISRREFEAAAEEVL
jgi:predicted RNA binding protein YcfA (HicA-like mRNA interferase family)